MLTRKVEDLRPHPENTRIYGGDVPEELVQSIREKGVLVPLLVTRHNVIISGHQRNAGAKRAGLAEVPVTVFGSDDELDILEALIHANRQRQKTNEQLAREAAKLMEVEGERAERRRLAGLKKGAEFPVQANSPERGIPFGLARDKVAEVLGVGAKKVEQAVEVVKQIDALEASGKAAEAAKAREVLNKQSVHAAYKLVTECCDADSDVDEHQQTHVIPPTVCDDRGIPIPADMLPEWQAHVELVQESISLGRKLSRNINKLARGKYGAYYRDELECRASQSTDDECRWSYRCTDLVRALQRLEQCAPHCCHCPYHPGVDDPDCRCCKGLGWVTRNAFNALPASKLRELNELALEGGGAA